MLFDDLKVYICPIDCALFHNFMMINVFQMSMFANIKEKYVTFLDYKCYIKGSMICSVNMSKLQGLDGKLL